MGNLINPLGGRVGILNFWRGTWPVRFTEKKQSFFFQLSIHVRFLIQAYIRQILILYPNQFSVHVLHGMVLNIISNVWGFDQENLNIYFNLYDYKISLLALKTLPHGFVLSNLITKVKKYFFLKSFFYKIKPSLFTSSFFKNKKTFRARCSLPFELGFLGSISFKKRIQKFLRFGILRFFKLLENRIKVWHLSCIVFTKPYIFFLCNFFKFKRCFFFMLISNSTITASMIARFIVLKFKQGFTLNFVLTIIRRTVNVFFKNSNGYKLCVAGRFTRKQIATYRWFKLGMVSLNQKLSCIDYVQDWGTSKFGIFGIKLWVFLSARSLLTFNF